MGVLKKKTPMKYVSTRGGVSGLSFCDAVMMGLASDGGLLVPEAIPDISAQLKKVAQLSYQELAFEVMINFIDDISPTDLRNLIDLSYSSFDEPLITPLVEVSDFHVMELFHGPTMAFKDVALQFLGNVFEHVLHARGGTLNILGATSGDTGSAAIAGVRGKRNINIFIMFPEGKTSELQERQMTSVLDDNVQNIAVEGSFDDCQSILKAIFNDLRFKHEHELGAVNSVNWARVLAQVTYYFSAYAQLGAPPRFDVAVPTGNFGNVFAGYIARRMGLPINRLILATNQNDILHRFFSSGVYQREEVHFSHSPAMDIQVASNFERYVYYELHEDSGKVREFMAAFNETGEATIDRALFDIDNAFISDRVNDPMTLSTIAQIHEETGYLLDPHTAVGVKVGRKHRSADLPLVCMATAHPAKFDQVIAESLPSLEVTHEKLEAVRDARTRKVILPADPQVIKQFIRNFQSG